MVLAEGEIIGKDVFPLVVVGIGVGHAGAHLVIGGHTVGHVVGTPIGVRTDTVEAVGLVVAERHLQAALKAETLERIEADVGIEINLRVLVVVTVGAVVVHQQVDRLVVAHNGIRIDIALFIIQRTDRTGAQQCLQFGVSGVLVGVAALKIHTHAQYFVDLVVNLHVGGVDAVVVVVILTVLTREVH